MKGGTGNRTRETGPKPPGGDSVEAGVGEEVSPFKDLMGELPAAPPPESGETVSAWGDMPDIRTPERLPGPLLKREGSEPSSSKSEPEESLPASPDILFLRLSEAGDKDAIADALVGYLGRDFERVALFVVKGRIAAGWRGVMQKTPIEGFEHFQFPLDEPTLLKVVVDTKNFYLGPILEIPGNARIVAGLGGGQPDSVLLIPIIMMDRVVTVFYVEGEKGLLGRRLFELQKLIGKAALAFEILILKNKILLA